MDNTIKEFDLKTEELKYSYMNNKDITSLIAILEHSINLFYLELPAKNVIEKEKEIINSTLDILLTEHRVYFLKNILEQDEINSLFDGDEKNELKDIFNKIIDKTGLENVLFILADEPREYFPTSFAKNNCKYNGVESCKQILTKVKVNNVNLFDLENSDQLFEYILKRNINDKKMSNVVNFLTEKINNDKISEHFFKNVIMTINICEENQISIEEEMKRKNIYFTLFDFFNIENIYDVDTEEVSEELDNLVYSYVNTVMNNTSKLFSDVCGDNKYTLPYLTDPFFFSGLIKYVADYEPQFIIELIEIMKKQGVDDQNKYHTRNQQTLNKILSLKEKESLEKTLNTSENAKVKKRL